MTFHSFSRPSVLPVLLIGLVLGGWAGLGSSTAQAPAPNPALEAARGRFEALTEVDRKAVQEALIWAGFYSGMADGSFGRQTFEAINAYLAAQRQPPTGTLSAPVQAALISAGRQARNAAGFASLDDPRSGVRIGVPAKVLPKQDASPGGGSRWQSADGRVTLDTRVAPADATLASLYERNLAIQSPGRVVSYKVLRPDFLVIAGETPTGKFYTRYAAGAAGAAGPAAIRGFSLGYDKALAPSVDRLVVAIANSFVPFPDGPAPAALPAASPAAPAPPVAQTSPIQTPPAPGLPGTRRLIGTGIAVSPRQVVTAGPLGACANLQVAGLKAQRVSGGAVTIIDVASDLKARPLALPSGSAADGAELVVVAFAGEDGADRLTAVPATGLGPKAATASLQNGAGGAPVLDSAGALVGIVAPLSGTRRMVAGIVPASGIGIVPAGELASASPSVASASPAASGVRRATADLVALVAPALVPITCGP